MQAWCDITDIKNTAYEKQYLRLIIKKILGVVFSHLLKNCFYKWLKGKQKKFGFYGRPILQEQTKESKYSHLSRDDQNKLFW